MPDMKFMDSPVAADIPVSRSHMALSYLMLRERFRADGMSPDDPVMVFLKGCGQTATLDSIIENFRAQIDDAARTVENR